MKTRVTELLGIKHPIILGTMHWVANAELAAAVSNAGGLGLISSARFKDGAELRSEIAKAKQLTDQPFGINLSLNPATRPIPNDEFIQVIIEERIPVVETSGARSPEEIIPVMHQAGIKVIHKAATIRHVLKGEKCGADAVTIVGFENGGNVGMEDVTTMVLVPKAAGVCQVPVIAGGGITDARGLVAALALGAEGVVMGSRFMATVESPVHPRYRDWILQCQENQTLTVQRSIRNTHRVLKNEAAIQVLEMESRGATLEELLPWISGDKYRQCILEGQLEVGMAYCGQAVGLIENIPTAKDLINSIMEETKLICDRLSGMVR